MPDRSFENKIKNLLEGLEIKPPDIVWQNINDEIAPVKKRRQYPILFILLALLLCIGSGSYFILHQEKAVLAVNDNADTNYSANKPIVNTTNTEETTSFNTDQPVSPIQTDPGKRVNSQSSLRQTTIAPSTNTNYWSGTGINTEIAKRHTDNTQLYSTIVPKVSIKRIIPPAGYRDTSLIAPFFSIGRNKKWEARYEIKTGLSSSYGNNILNAEYERAGLDYFGSTPINSSTPPVVTAAKTKSGITIGASVFLERTLSKRLTFATGLQYQYSNYQSDYSFYLYDTVYQQQTYVINKISGEKTNKLHFHSINLPALLHVKVSNPVQITGGVINSFSLSSVCEQSYYVNDPYFYSPGLNGGTNSGKFSIDREVKKYIPQGYLSLDIIPFKNTRKQWSISPWLQFDIADRYKNGGEKLIQYGIGVSMK